MARAGCRVRAELLDGSLRFGGELGPDYGGGERRASGASAAWTAATTAAPGGTCHDQPLSADAVREVSRDPARAAWSGSSARRGVVSIRRSSHQLELAGSQDRITPAAGG
jgi:hypothetical protein